MESALDFLTFLIQSIYKPAIVLYTYLRHEYGEIEYIFFFVIWILIMIALASHPDVRDWYRQSPFLIIIWLFFGSFLVISPMILLVFIILKIAAAAGGMRVGMMFFRYPLYYIGALVVFILIGVLINEVEYMILILAAVMLSYSAINAANYMFPDAIPHGEISLPFITVAILVLSAELIPMDTVMEFGSESGVWEIMKVEWILDYVQWLKYFEYLFPIGLVVGFLSGLFSVIQR